MCLIFLGLSNCSTPKSQQTAAEKTIASLTPYQQGALDLFFRTLLTETSVGYTLYGDKPLSAEDSRTEEILHSLAEHHWARMGCLLKVGYRIWKESGLSNIKSNYEICMSERLFYGWGQIAFINVRSFLDTVNHNLPLFQYALGPMLTAEALLDQFRDPSKNLDSIFHGDRVLNGIILGYGTCNALMGSRCEYLHEYSMGFCPKQLGALHDPSSIRRNAPSFGFSTLDLELASLTKDEVITTTYESPIPRLPWFGSFKTTETDQLLAGYQSVQKKLKEVLASPDFLGEIFSRIFGERLSTPKPLSSFVSLLKAELRKEKSLSVLLGQSIGKSLQVENGGKPLLPMELEAFIRGMSEMDTGSSTPISFNEARRESYKWAHLLQARNNLEEAETFIRRLINVQAVIPEQIYYRSIVEGSGTVLEPRTSEVKIHYTITSIEGKVLQAENDRVIQISDLIPGFQLGMREMKIGEVRDIYIHPRWGYGEEDHQDPNLGLIVRVKLLETCEQGSISEPIPLQLKSTEYPIDEIKKEYVSRGNELLNLFGQKTWARYRLLKSIISLDDVIRGLNESIEGKFIAMENQSEIIEQLELLSWLSLNEPIFH